VKRSIMFGGVACVLFLGAGRLPAQEPTRIIGRDSDESGRSLRSASVAHQGDQPPTALRTECKQELFLEARHYQDMRRFGEFPHWGAPCVPDPAQRAQQQLELLTAVRS
jgi:hypothetical protein